MHRFIDCCCYALLLCLLSFVKVAVMTHRLNVKNIRAISFDVTGTLLVHKDKIASTYVACAHEAQLPDPPSVDAMSSAFKKAYKSNHLKYPCFGHNKMCQRDWWYIVVKDSLAYCNKLYSDDDLKRYFRAVYQHYGSLDGYELLGDATDFLNANRNRFSYGITSNTPTRTIETVLPMLGVHKMFKWSVCSADIGFEKPQSCIFEETLKLARFHLGEHLEKSEVLHIGDSLEADYFGAKSFGFQALFLDRSGNQKVTQYSNLYESLHYDGKSEEDIANNTVTNFSQVQSILDGKN